MSELRIKDRLVDKIHGVVILVDAYHDGKILFKVEKTGAMIYRTLKDVQSMPRAQPEGRFKAFCKSALIGGLMVLICTGVVYMSSKVVIHTETEKQQNERIHIEPQKKQTKQADN